MMPLWLSAAGGVGAMSRFVADGLIRTVLGRKFPWATLIINVIGSFILGVIVGAVLYRHGSTNLKLIVGTGFCGGFTTFSTASFETVRLIEERKFAAVVAQSLGNLLFSLTAALCGVLLMK